MATRELSRIAVYCGSSSGSSPVFELAARDLGRMLAKRGITLIYGGGSTGLMGAVADGALSADGQVIGVIPHALMIKELGHIGVSDLRVVDTMHERKAIISELADGFIALPGGLGTFEEILETITWLQLGIHGKPCGFLNVDGFYDRLLDFLDHAAAAGFIRISHRDMVMFEDDAETLLARFSEFEKIDSERWVTRAEA